MKTTQEIWESNDVKVHGDISLDAFKRYGNIVIKYVKPKFGENILDCGCGSGEITKIIKKKTNCNIMGFDFSSTLLSIAQNNSKNIIFFKQDALKEWKTKNAYFDKVYSFDFLQYIQRIKLSIFFKYLSNSLKQGGVAYMLDVPDDKYLFSFIKGKRLRTKLYVFIRYFLNKEIFAKDHSYWHNRDKIKKVASNYFKKIEFINSECFYRSHIILRK